MGQALGTMNAPSASRGIVMIHGAGDWQPDYWQPVVDQIEELIGDNSIASQFGAVGVHYSDVMSAPAPLIPPLSSLAPNLPQFRDAFLNELLRDKLVAAAAALSSAELLQKIIAALLPGGASMISALEIAQALLGGTRTPETLLDTLTHALMGAPATQARQTLAAAPLPGQSNVGATIEDVYQYLYNPSFAKQIKQRLIDGLHQAQQFQDVTLISHSLGTVIAFDVLNEWNETTPKISYWFTLGCPLAKVLRLRPGTPNRLTNADVTRWYNVYDTTDLIGGALGPLFTKPGYSIYDIFVDISNDPIKAHDYFDNVTTLQIIADALRAGG